MLDLRAVIFDLDGTLTPVRSVWRHLHERLGLWTGMASRHQDDFEAGRIDYAEFCARDAARWKGMREADLRRIADAIPFRDGARECVRNLRSAGCVIGVVSTGLTLLTDRVRDELDLAFVTSNRLLAVDGVLTGGVKINVEHDRKEEALDLFCGQFGFQPRQVIVLGDSSGDISMFQHAGFSVAVRPACRRTAEAATMIHDHESLAGLVARLPLPRSGTVTGGPDLDTDRRARDE